MQQCAPKSTQKGKGEMEQDFLEEMVQEATRRNPDFPRLYAEAWEERLAMHAMNKRRNRRILLRKRATGHARLARMHDMRPEMVQAQS